MDLEVVRYNALTNYYPHLPEMGFNDDVFILISSYL
jgi:hypothetical protein